MHTAIDYLSLANSYRNLGVLYRYQNKPDLAKHFFEVAGLLRLRYYPKNSVPIAEIMKDLGDSFFHDSLNKLDESIFLFNSFTKGANFYFEAYQAYKKSCLKSVRTISAKRGVEQYLLLLADFIRREIISKNDIDVAIVEDLWNQMKFRGTFLKYLNEENFLTKKSWFFRV